MQRYIWDTNGMYVQKHESNFIFFFNFSEIV